MTVAATPDERGRLRRIHEILSGLQHPNLEQPARFEDDGNCTVLELRDVPGTPLHELTLTTGEAAGLCSAVASIAAELHERGFAHGGIEARTVILTPHGRPVLTAMDPTDADSAEDVAAIGRMLLALLGDKDHIDDALSRLQKQLSSRRRFSLSNRAPKASERGALMDLARAANHPDPAARPMAAELADSITRLVPDASLPGASPGLPKSKARFRRLTFAAAAAGVIALVFGAISYYRGESPARPAAVTSPPVASTTTRPITVAPGSRAFDGRVVNAGQDYVVGERGDQVAKGDWVCNDIPTIALLRPTGEVFVFPTWPEGQEGIEGRLVGRVTDAVGFVPTDADGDGCDELLVERVGGAVVLDPKESA